MKDPLVSLFHSSNTLLATVFADPHFVINVLVMLVLLLFSALIAAAEVGFFSLSPAHLEKIKSNLTPVNTKINELLRAPKKLLATIVVSHNLVNIGIIITSESVVDELFHFTFNPTLAFLIRVVMITFLLLLIGEVIPKIYSTQHAIRVATKLAYPLAFMQKLLSPISAPLLFLTSLIDSRIKHRAHDISVDDLSHAIELTPNEHTPEEEHKILKGIVKFGNTDVKQIMKPRMDVIAFDIETSFEELVTSIIESGFSRVPVYEDSFDNIKGILYIKDLLPYLEKDAHFKWTDLLRKPFFVPENKKIDDLLKEFQQKKTHLAIVVDEYGGTSGIVTFEDIIEEIVGDISDEFDDEELTYSKLDDNTFVFEGKIPLNDMCRVMDVDTHTFEDKKGEADSLGGYILEQLGTMPRKNQKIESENFIFEIESVDRRKIKRVKVLVKNREDNASDKTNTIFSAASILLLFLPLFFVSCSSDFVPKPRGYFRIDFPEKKYVPYKSECDFTFETPVYSNVLPYKGAQNEKCWLNISYPKYSGTLHLSYFPLQNDLAKHTEDSRNLAYKHSVKAEAIEEYTVSDSAKSVYGVIYEINGNTASSLQFYLTDNISHFVRGALYFNAQPNSDSIAPVEKFIKADVDRMIRSFNWK